MTQYFGEPANNGAVEVLDEDNPERGLEIVVNGVQLGMVDVRTLKARALFDLEEIQLAHDLLDWLQKYAGVSEDDIPTVKEELAEMPIQAIIDLARSIAGAIGQAMKIPKASRQPSKPPLNTKTTRQYGR